jgi:hypothetical protein
MAKAKTTAQVVVDFSTGELDTRTVGSFDTFREMRKDPTISLLRKYVTAYSLASTWGVDGHDEDQKAFLEEHILPFRQQFMRTALFGLSDFGWKAYELVYGEVDLTFPSGDRRKLMGVDEIKPLKNDNTRARYDKSTGAFLGFAHADQYNGTKYLIDAEHSLFVNFDDEGTGCYGTGCMEVAQQPYDEWNDANDAAARYDKKLAGTFLVVRYPIGKTPYKGTETDNATIAEDIIKAIRASGSVSIPLGAQDIVNELQKVSELWKIEFLDPGAKQASFNDRLK